MRYWRQGLRAAAALLSATSALAADYRARLPQDETIYFVLPDRFENGDRTNDRGGLTGDRLVTGYDPAHKGFYHGGDLKGLTARLDYLQGMGITAIWLAPVFKNKAVQGAPGKESAGYHGYWVTNFTQVDPHFGSEAAMAAFVAAAHARGMKVYLDIIANHTADVIKYRECPNNDCAYRSRADYPYQTRGGPAGAPINPGFAGDRAVHQTPANFAKLTAPDFAYTPYIPAGEEAVKVPAWLNDPIYYHNRGDSTFRGESSTMGDFSGLDDLYTENPRVVAGFIEIFGSWIDRFKIDGYRIDTAQHVNPEFWAAFAPAMAARAKANGIDNFAIFGEVFTSDMDPGRLARHTRVDKLPTVLDFAFRAAVAGTAGGTAPTSLMWRLFADDALYEGGTATAMQLPTFLGNHDDGRFAMTVRKQLPNISDDELLARVQLGHAMLLTLRGAPVIYSGDEQGFTGDGGDQDAREDMFASQVASYNDNKLVGSTSTTAQSSFNTESPLYREIAALAALRHATPALRRGTQIVRGWGEAPGLFAVSRFDPVTGQEVLIAFNTATKPLDALVEVEVTSLGFTALRGPCAAKASAPGSVRVTLPPLGYAICAGTK